MRRARFRTARRLSDCLQGWAGIRWKGTGLAEAEGPNLAVEITGISLRNPLLVCSGTFGNGREYSDWLSLEGLGGIITKAVTLLPCNGNPPPRLWEVTSGLLNSIGLENKGVEAFLQEDLAWLNRFDLP